MSEKYKTIKSIMLAIAMIIMLSPAWAQAHDLTRKAVTVIIPFPPGGGVDQTYQHFRRYLNSQNITTNAVYKSGADGLIGMNELQLADNDGFTISIGTVGTVAVHELNKSGPGLIMVSAIRNSINAFVSSSASGVKTWADLESRLRQNRLIIGQGAPGQKMSVNQVIKLVNPAYSQQVVGYRGGAPVVNDLLGGHIDFAVLPMSLVHSHIQQGRLTLVGLGSQHRLDNYQNIPTVYEKLPLWKEFDGFLLILPPNTAKSIQTAWMNMITKYLDDPQVRKEFTDNFFELLPIGPATTRQLVNQSLEYLK